MRNRCIQDNTQLMPTLSVLMSVYHKDIPTFFDMAVASVCEKQSRKPDEVVLVEDGPLGEELLEVVDKWKGILGDKMIILSNKENIGLTKSLNKGLVYVKSDYIARMDSDDVSTPNRFEKQVAYLESHPDVAIVGGSVREFNSQNSCLGERHYPEDNDEVLRYICKASPLAHPAVMMRREIFSNGGLKYDERVRTSQDIALWFDALCAGYKIGNIDDIVLNFRLEGDIYKRRSRKKAWGEFRIYMSGIRRLYGLVTYRYIYPVMRLLFRCLPSFMVGRIYNSRVRTAILTPPEPLISIITACYNSRRYLSDTIGSVLSQSYANWEMLIQDDCSTDGSFELAQEFSRKDPRIKVERNQINLGAAVTRNNAIRRSKGEYLAFLDSDDLWVAEKLERQLRFMQENGCNFSFTRYEHISETGESLHVQAKVIKHLTYRKFLFHCWTGCLTVMYRQDLDNKIYAPEVPNSEDYALFLRVLKRCKTAGVGMDECLAYYRIHQGSLSRNKLKKIKSQLQVFTKDNGIPYIGAWLCLFVNMFVKAFFKYKKV